MLDDDEVGKPHIKLNAVEWLFASFKSVDVIWRRPLNLWLQNSILITYPASQDLTAGQQRVRDGPRWPIQRTLKADQRLKIRVVEKSSTYQMEEYGWVNI